MTTVSNLGFLLIDFYLKALSNHLFLLNIFMVIFKKSSNFLSISLFNIHFRIISSYYKSRSTNQLLIAYFGGDAQHEWRGRSSHDWSCE